MSYNQNKETKELKQIIPAQIQEINTLFYTSTFGENGKKIWDILCDVSFALHEEVQKEPALSFTLTEEESRQFFYPQIKSFIQAEKRFQNFYAVLKMYGQIIGVLPVEESVTLYDFYSCFYLGRAGIDTLVKVMNILLTYYHRYEQDGQLFRSLDLLWNYFQPNELLFSQMFSQSRPQIGLGNLQDEIWKLEKHVSRKNHGETRREYRNENGALLLKEDGTLAVVLDSQAITARNSRGENEEMWTKFCMAMNAVNIYIDDGSHNIGDINIYNILSGADMYRALHALHKATFLTDDEVYRLEKKFFD